MAVTARSGGSEALMARASCAAPGFKLPRRTSRCAVIASACTPASVRPAATGRATSSALLTSGKTAARRVSCTLRAPGCDCQPTNAAPSQLRVSRHLS